MLVATENFEFTDSLGDRDTIKAGVTHCAADAEVVQRHPDRFKSAKSRAAQVRTAEQAWHREALERAGRNIGRGPLPANAEPGDGHWGNERRVSSGGNPHTAQGAQDLAYRAIEARSQEFKAPEGDRLWDLIGNDRHGIDSRYLAAATSPEYESAFFKLLADPVTGHLRHTPAEVEAMRAAVAVVAERAITLGGGGATEFPVPTVIDPTVMISSAGAVSPLRELATVQTIGTLDWKGVSSDGVSAAFAAELTEVGDGTPTLVQPTITTQRAHSYVPFSIEASQDAASLQSELGRLFQDAKNALESEKFLTGTGTDEPQGLLVGATNVVETAAADAYALADAYSMQEALPPRFQPNAAWLGSNAIRNATRRFVASGDTTEPQIFVGDSLLNRPFREASDMDTTVVAGNQVLVYGDLRAGYRIIDRIGLSIELVPLVLGANRRPIGARALYAYWRVGAGVVVDNAIRVLEVAAAGSG